MQPTITPDWWDENDGEYEETDQEYAERIRNYEERFFVCRCPHCRCSNGVENGGVCNQCFDGAHQG